MSNERRNIETYLENDCDGNLVYTYEYINNDEEEFFYLRYWNPLISKWEYDTCYLDDEKSVIELKKLAKDIVDDLYGRRKIVWTIDEEHYLTDMDRGMIRQAYYHRPLEEAQAFRKTLMAIRWNQYDNENF